MKEFRFLERTAYVLESVHLAIMTWCISLPILFFFPSSNFYAMLLWGLGAAIPVLLIRETARRIHPRWIRLLSGIGITALFALIPRGIIGITYLICGGAYTLVGAFFPRPDGKLLLTVPKLYHALIILLEYAFGVISQISLLNTTAIILALIFSVNFLLHRNCIRLLQSLRDDPDASISGQSIISQNRKMIISFVVLGAILIIALPWVLQHREAAIDPLPLVSPAVSETIEDPATAETEMINEGSLTISLPGISLPIGTVVNGSLVLVLFFAAMIIFLAVAAVILFIGMFRDDRDKRHRPLKENHFVVESLMDERQKKTNLPDPPEDNWQRKIRRQYKKLISATTKDVSGRAAMTPTELETAAKLPETSALAQVHRLYAQARYGENLGSKEDYQLMKSAVKTLSDLNNNPPAVR